MISSTRVKICRAIHHLNDLIGNDKQHLNLTDPVTQIAILPNIRAHAKILLVDRLPPCTITFKYKGDLTVFVSTTNKLPSLMCNQQHKHKPVKIIVAGRFVEDYIYLTLQSEQGLSCEVKVQFPAAKQKQ